MQVYKFKIFEPFKDIIDHGIFTKEVSIYNITSETHHDTESNKALIAEYFGVNYEDIAIPEQVHGKDLAKVENPSKVVPNVDGLITDTPNLLLIARTADCLPVLFFNPKTKEIATVHAGREGVYKKILIETTQKMSGSPNDLLVGIGPHICKNCYTLDKVPFEFEEFFNGKSLDLTSAALDQLKSQGIPENQIEVMPICTKENNHIFPSYRGGKSGNLASCILLK